MLRVYLQLSSLIRYDLDQRTRGLGNIVPVRVILSINRASFGLDTRRLTHSEFA
jgi:hypothetical protein